MSNSTRNWSRLARFIAVEDGKVHYGQPVDGQVDVGLALQDRKEVQAYEIQGVNPPFDGTVNTQAKLTIAKLLSPLPMEDVAGSIRCLGVNYRKHVEEAGLKIPEFPVLFMKPDTALAGPGDIPIPKFVTEDPGDEASGSEQLDYETELAFIVSKDAKDIKEEDAGEYILGFTGANDITARFHQGRQAQWNFAKSFDSFCPIGPILVSPATIGNPQDVDFKGSLNGDVKQDANTGDMIFTVYRTLASLSSGTTIRAGSIVLMGTPSGIGWFSKPKRLLRNGDVFTVWHSGGIGSLVNRIVFE